MPGCMFTGELPRLQTQREAYKCAICSFNCSQIGIFKFHMAKHQKRATMTELDISKVDHPYAQKVQIELKCSFECPTSLCSKCGLDVAHEDIASHELNHNSEEFCCASCDAKFKSQIGLMAHQTLHAPKMNFFCLLCDYGSLDEKSLSNHIKKHKNLSQRINLYLEDIYSCLLCGYSTNKRKHLKAHIHTAHSPKSPKESVDDLIQINGTSHHSCRLCDYWDYKLCRVRHHIESKHKDLTNISKCDKCAFVTQNNVELKEHQCQSAKRKTRDVRNSFKKRRA